MRYKPERALTPVFLAMIGSFLYLVEMRYKPERALTRTLSSIPTNAFSTTPGARPLVLNCKRKMNKI